MLKKLFASLGCIVLCCGCFAAAPVVTDPATAAETLQLLAKIENAANPSGKKVSTIQIGYTLEMPMQGINGTIAASLKTPDKYRLEVVIPGMPKSIEIYDGKSAWLVTEGFGVKPKVGRELNMTKFQARLSDPNTKLTDAFESIILDKARSTVNAEECYRLVGTPKKEWELPAMEMFVSVKNSQLVRTTITIVSAIGEIPSVTDYSNFRTFDGLVIPGEQKTQVMGMAMTSKITSVQLDSPIDDKLFTVESANESGAR